MHRFHILARGWRSRLTTNIVEVDIGKRFFIVLDPFYFNITLYFNLEIKACYHTFRQKLQTWGKSSTAHISIRVNSTWVYHLVIFIFNVQQLLKEQTLLTCLHDYLCSHIPGFPILLQTIQLLCARGFAVYCCSKAEGRGRELWASRPGIKNTAGELITAEIAGIVGQEGYEIPQRLLTGKNYDRGIW